jgi:hypothetical protein
MLLLFALASPVAVAGALVRGPGLGGVFLVAAVLYFLMYEGFHSLYHMPPRVLRALHLADNRVFVALMRHHRRHHHLDRMSFVNLHQYQ